MPDPKYRRVKNQQRVKPKANGFTLVEMLVTVFILGLLTTIVVLAVLPNQDKAMVQKAKADIATLSQAMEIYRLDNAAYPDAGQGLQALAAPPAGGGAGGAYIKKLPNDPWGRPYQYSNPGRNGGFDIYSLGADGAPGGENENADIYSG
ncbi:type II secretion system major pseudopilin GspG [Sphingorhabdus arenilitoris]|uniref:Type II secretion system core protein G n=1 Tax=Sphingorhabdus arenilitoris TaxID=1490041 RepID=A0ABV8RJF6_9SPHN